MELNFLGTGSAFNTKLGNTSAYIKENQGLLLIDCGGMVFHELNQLGVLENLKCIYITITHTHPDHVASLGEVIFYAHFILKIKTVLIFPERDRLETLLRIMGVTEEMYAIKDETSLKIDDGELGRIQIDMREVRHVETMKAYSLVMTDGIESIYYSGDASHLPTDIVQQLEQNQLSAIYQDTCGLDYPGNPHCYIGHLEQQIPLQLRDRVYCIHLDKHLSEQQVKEKGFQTVQIQHKQ